MVIGKLFKDGAGEKEKNADKLNKFKDASGKELQQNQIPGYFDKKIKYQITSVSDFIYKLHKTSICNRFFT